MTSPTLANVHPADELAAIREEIAQMTKRADFLRDQLLAKGASLEGDSYRALLVPGKRETLDRKALTDMFGEEAIAPFLKTTNYTTVKVVEK